MPEDYKPQKHEWGRPEASAWARSMTPGQETADEEVPMPAKKAAPEKKKKFDNKIGDLMSKFKMMREQKY